ncbi:hypothetical protein GALMADRAFT_160159 [Galerina marginata CBS 339.88]|uniref:Fucose-specific lectin n=1 Tax=Galerina marginata (strain CBS 339.88) TaxID=685588 RepID=A0A067SQR4_GALM3|nr:hypothetical protein GALMADRAFT_160159 [Galerina marginata CBS 339.88]
MSLKYLPDTALATISISKSVFTYAQGDNGGIVECQGQLDVPLETQDQDIYVFDQPSWVTARYQNNLVRPNAPKLFTPLAASTIASTKYVFYVDDTNTLRGLKSGPTWAQEATLAALAVRVAHYSQLAAVNIAENNFEAIVLYFQSPKKDAGIEFVSLSSKNNQWVKDKPDMTPIPPPPPVPPPRVVDPPLYGTALTAVRTRPGIEVFASKMPVVYLQWDTLALAHSQESKVETFRTLDLKFAPHTSLAIVDDGTQLYCFYTSSHNNNIKMITIKDYKASPPVIVGTPTPRSTIAAVLPTKDRIVLFYQALNFDLSTVELKGLTFVRNTTTNVFAPLPNTEPALLA